MRKVKPILTFKDMYVINSHQTVKDPLFMAHWPFSGNANDVTGNGNDGTVTGATLTTDKDGNANSAYYFDGNDYITIGDKLDIGLSDRGLSVWINPDNLTSGIRGIVSKSILAVGAFRWAIYQNTASLIFRVTKSDSNALTDLIYTIPAASAWYHIVVNLDRDGNMTMHVNNALASTVSMLPISGQDIQSSYPLRISSFNDGSGNPGNHFVGKIDNVRVYDRLITDDERKNFYDNYL